MSESTTHIADLKKRFQRDLVPLLPPIPLPGHHGTEEEILSSQGKQMVWLLRLSDPVLIVPASTNVVYRCQVGGYACLPKWMEGFLIPLNPLERDAAIFHTLKMWEWDERNPRFVAEVQRQLGDTSENVGHFAAVEHEDNTEAWVWSQFTLNGEVRYGVVTWENSD